MANGIHTKTDQEFEDLLSNLAQKAPAMQAELGLTPQQVQEIEDASAAFGQAHAATERALTTYRAAVQDKDTKRERATALLARLISAWKHNKTVQDDSLAAVGIERDQKKRREVPVFRPAKLQVNTHNTVNTLTWEPNGNEYRTVYRIEYRYHESEDWALLDLTTKTKYRHTGRTPGEPVYYRVSAQRSERLSGATTPVVAYTPEKVVPKAA